jgi:hypothetical protein
VNRLEELLNMLIKGSSAEDWKCLNRLEQYLICILTRSSIEALGEPMNRLEVLLRALYEVVPENAVEILTARLEPSVPSADESLALLSARLEKQKY